jgi:hypothetical protein
MRPPRPLSGNASQRDESLHPKPLLIVGALQLTPAVGRLHQRSLSLSRVGFMSFLICWCNQQHAEFNRMYYAECMYNVYHASDGIMKVISTNNMMHSYYSFYGRLQVTQASMSSPDSVRQAQCQGLELSIERAETMCWTAGGLARAPWQFRRSRLTLLRTWPWQRGEPPRYCSNSKDSQS